MNAYYPNLFSPIRIKNIIYKNRIEASPMGNVPTHRFISAFPDYGGVMFYDKSIGGAGSLHVVSHGLDNNNAYVSNGSDPFSKYHRDVLREQLSVGKQHGANTSLVVGINSFFDNKLMGPSNKKAFEKEYNELPKEAISMLIDNVATNAKKVKDFGFDLLMLDIAHDSIVAQFMAPAYNERTDEYGGSYENRFRFAKELVEKTRKAVGDDFVIELRLSAVLHVPGSYEFSEMLDFIKSVEDKIDIVNVVSGMDDNRLGNVNAVAMNFLPHCKNAQYAKQIKEKCNVYVSVGGAIMSPEEGEEIIANNVADFVMYGRALIADPFLPNKAKTGHSEDIRPCLRCNYCYHISTEHYQTVCSVNPRFFREKRVPLVLEKASVLKKVAVIGAGPAGCIAAITASQRGHIVDLYEKSNEVGGALKLADFEGKHKIDLKRYKDYLTVQIKKSSVNFIPNCYVTPEKINDKYDVIIVAIGGSPIELPNIKIDKPHISTYDYAMQNVDKLGQRVSIIGGGSIGVEFADYLASLGKQVSLFEKKDILAANSNILYKLALEVELKNVKIDIHKNCLVTSVRDGKITYSESGIEASTDYDNVVICVGVKSNLSEAETFMNSANEVYYVGDCKKVAKVLEATNDAYFIASNL